MVKFEKLLLEDTAAMEILMTEVSQLMEEDETGYNPFLNCPKKDTEDLPEDIFSDKEG